MSTELPDVAIDAITDYLYGTGIIFTGLLSEKHDSVRVGINERDPELLKYLEDLREHARLIIVALRGPDWLRERVERDEQRVKIYRERN
jgi:hypothetical protein